MPADAALAVVYSHGKVLAVQRPDSTEMALPGGGVDRGETPAAAAARELREETGVTATALRYLGHAPSPTDSRRVHVFLVTNWDGTPYAAEGLPVRWMEWRMLRAQARRYGTFLDRVARALHAQAA